jgi:hypothetical protein
LVSLDAVHFNLIYFVREFTPTLIVLCLVIGASLLWNRSKRISALAQLLASAGLLFVALVEHLQSFATPFDKSSFAQVLWSPWTPEAKIGIAFASAIVFSVAYLCYSIRSKSSNHAIQRTAPRSDA